MSIFGSKLCEIVMLLKLQLLCMSTNLVSTTALYRPCMPILRNATSAIATPCSVSSSLHLGNANAATHASHRTSHEPFFAFIWHVKENFTFEHCNEGTKKKCEGIKTAIVRDVSRGMAKKSKLYPGGARSPGTRPHPADPILGQNAAS